MQHKSRNLKGKAEVVNIHFQPEDFFFFPLVSQRTIRKIVLFLPVRVIAICTVIKIHRNSKLEVVNIRGFFLFPSSFPTNDKEDCFIVSCACPSYLYSNKEKQKLETGSRSNGAPRIFLLSTFITLSMVFSAS